MHRSALVVFVCSFLPVLVGCSTVTSVHPVGHVLTDNPCAEFTGTWMGGEGHHLQIHCSGGGELQFAALEWKNDEGAFEMETGQGVLRTLADQTVFNYVEDTEADEPEYAFFLVKAEGGQLVVWSPDVGVFRELVENGALEGLLVEGEHSTSVVLTAPGEELGAAIAEQDLARLFDWSEPALVLVRVGAE